MNKTQMAPSVEIVIENAPYAVVGIDAEGRVVEWNKQAEVVFGWPRNEIIGKRISETIMPARFREEYHHRMQEFLNKRTSTYLNRPMELVALHHDGSEFPIDLTVVSVPVNNTFLFYVFIRDIRNEKQAEALLRSSEVRLKSILANLPVAVTVHNGKNFLYVNDETVRILGYSTAQEIIGKEVLSIVHPSDRDAVIQRMKTAQKTGQPRPLREEKFLRKDGGVVIAEIYSVCIEFDGVPCILAFGRDISHKKNAEKEKEAMLRKEQEALAENARMLEQTRDAVDLRDEFISVAAHELRTPLTSIGLQIQILRRKLDKQKPFQTESEKLFNIITPTINQFDIQVERLTKLVNDLLDVWRIQAGQLVIHKEMCDLVDLVRSAISRYCPGQQCRLIKAMPDKILGFWDSTRLEQVIANLLSNAEKYGEGKPIEVTVLGEDATASVQIRDQGVGIAAEDRRRIFDRYQRGASFRSFGGIGLGLYISKQIVDAHGGKISVKSQLGFGSTFSLELPIGG